MGILTFRDSIVYIVTYFEYWLIILSHTIYDLFSLANFGD